ncbi:MAG: hypothetical protein SGI88_02675, partial [Candidatus Hydrogenedentes bacterium]|nr:hypothetical protein [Candidatus Hydrogenedentota bacterium]
LRSDVTVTPPLPESLWSEFEIECGRNFMEKPAVVRVRVMADDKLAGSFSAVLGKKAMRNGVSAKIDLLKPFAGQAPDSFLVKIVGDLYLMGPGTDENKLNAETASSQEYSQALRGSIIRVNVARAEGEQPIATPVDPPALGDAAAAVTPPTLENAPVSDAAPTAVPPSPAP